MSTLTLIGRLPSYSLLTSGSHIDPFVQEIMKESFSPCTMRALDDYTRGMYSIDLHYAHLMRYERPLSVEASLSKTFRDNPAFHAAVAHLTEQLSCIKATSITRDNLDKVAYVASSSADYGYVGSKANNFLLARRNATRALYGYKKYRSNYRFVPDKAYARTQLALKANPKIRHVWGRAFHHILIEGLIAQPLIQQIMLNETPIYIGRDIHKDLPYRITQLSSLGNPVYCIDFSSFDSTVCDFLVVTAWNILEKLLNLDAFASRLTFQFCKELFRHTPLVMPDGKLFSVKTGIPSGSYFTQLIGSIINAILIYMLMFDVTGSFHYLKVLGDDSIFSIPQLLSLDAIKAYFIPLGMKVSEKTIITRNFNEIYFLGHNFYGSRVTREEFTCLSLALHTEQSCWLPQQSIVRLASLLYDCGFNSFGMYNVYKRLVAKYPIDWSLEIDKPIDFTFPFTKIFVLS